jgi:hypothetical protein
MAAKMRNSNQLLSLLCLSGPSAGCYLADSIRKNENGHPLCGGRPSIQWGNAPEMPT